MRSLRVRGLEPVSFDLAVGECVALRGASGTGKTLLLRAIADLDPNEGEVSLDGLARAALPAPLWRRRVMYLAAEPGWWAERVGEHFADWSAARPVIEALLLPHTARDWPVGRLSTGERQRLAFARALALKPQVLLLDEPTAGLDEAATRAAEKLLAEHLARGGSALWVTHDPGQARRLSRRALLVEAGRVREGAP